MEEILRGLLPVAVVAVGVVLGFGLWNMMRGPNPGRSQMLMRWRIILQFIAIALALGALYFTR